MVGLSTSTTTKTAAAMAEAPIGVGLLCVSSSRSWSVAGSETDRQRMVHTLMRHDYLESATALMTCKS